MGKLPPPAPPPPRQILQPVSHVKKRIRAEAAKAALTFELKVAELGARKRLGSRQ